MSRAGSGSASGMAGSKTQAMSKDRKLFLSLSSLFLYWFYSLAGFSSHCGWIVVTVPDYYIFAGTNPAERESLSHWYSSQIPGLALVGPDWLSLGQMPTH